MQLVGQAIVIYHHLRVVGNAMVEQVVVHIAGLHGVVIELVVKMNVGNKAYAKAAKLRYGLIFSPDIIEVRIVSERVTGQPQTGNTELI